MSPSFSPLVWALAIVAIVFLVLLAVGVIHA